jgi:citrate lyase subunit beta/citryl-CoA lyase
MAQARAVAATACVQRLMFGTIDFQLELDIDGDGDELLAFRSELVLASRLAGVQSAGRWPLHFMGRYRAAHSRRATCRASSDSGGKLCIHPKQIAP